MPRFGSAAALPIDIVSDRIFINSYSPLRRHRGRPFHRYKNLYSYVGQWSGFSPDWLRTEIVRNLRDRPRRTRFWTLFPITRCLMLSQTDVEWKKLIAIIRRRRNERAI